MSESYTVGGDTDAEVSKFHVEGQTFRVVEEHTLEWVDLDIKLPSFVTRPAILIYSADAHHQPTGDYLVRNRGMIYPYRITGVLRRVRFPMQSLKLHPSSYYAIVVRYSPTLLEPPLQWRYDAGDATYPRGLRIRSEDNGVTWTPHVGDDHIFVEFGTPPAPPPPPDPPIPNFTPIHLGWTNTPTMLKLVTWTSVPCHLYMVWTTIPPEKHLDNLYRRGAIIGKALRTCFVEWNTNEQEEAGDTLYHTFLKPEWPICETRYFTFRAKVAGEWSPSVGPIFNYHREEIAMKGPYYAQIDATPWVIYLIRYVSGQSYPQCWGASEATTVASSSTRFASQHYGGVNKYTIHRKPIYFDTSIIPDEASIYGAILSVHINGLDIYAKDVYLFDAPELHDPAIKEDYGYIRTLTSPYISRLLEGEYTWANRNFWKITPAGLATINKQGKTKWAFRTIDDVNSVAPVGSFEGIYVDFEPEHLTVVYYLPE